MSAIRSQEKELHEKTRAFLEGLKPEDQIGLVFHDDLDGFASARLFYEFLNKKGCNNIETGVFSIGHNNPFGLQEIKNANKLIVLDLATNLVSFDLTNENKPTLYIDHHKKEEGVEFGDNIIEIRKEGYVPVSRTSYEILEGYVLDLDWLSLAGVLFDKGDRYTENIQFIREILIKNNLRLNDFNRDIVYPITGFIIYFEDNLRKAFSILESVKTIRDIDKIKKYAEPVEREIERFINLYETEKEVINGINFFYFEPKFGIKSIVTTTISELAEEETFIFASPSGENMIGFSARCQSKKIDVAELLKRLVEGFEDATAGGHRAAAGAKIRKEDMPRFLERLKHVKF